MKTKISLLGALMALIGYGITSMGQPDTPVLTYQWTPPSTGTVADHYVAEQRIVTVGGDTAVVFLESIPDTTSQVSYIWGVSTQLRVAAVDSLDRQGEWSIWSEPWTDHGYPGQPGQPIRFLSLVE